MSARRYITDAELERIADALRAGYPDGVPRQIVDMAVDWVTTVRIRYALLQLLLAGELEMSWGPSEDDWIWRRRRAA